MATIGELIWRDWLAAAIESGALGPATTAIAVATVQSSPPIGTPEPFAKRGNSARPERFVEAISEQVKR